MDVVSQVVAGIKSLLAKGDKGILKLSGKNTTP
jgi:hypothetical protein